LDPDPAAPEEFLPELESELESPWASELALEFQWGSALEWVLAWASGCYTSHTPQTSAGGSRDTAGADAAVIITDEHTSFFVDCRVKEVEQVSTRPAATNSAALNWITRRRIDGRPGLTTIVGGRDKEIPDAAKRRLIKVRPPGRRAKERVGRSVWIAGDHRWEHAILNSQLRAGVGIVNPRLSFVFRNSNVCMAIVGLVSEIQSAVGGRGD
jgi:hypothetical protein